MIFYYENNMGDCGVFSEENLVKAIYTAWNIGADLYLINNGVKKLNRDDYKSFREQTKLVFCPLGCNEFNSELLEEFGYYMEDVNKYREIKEISTGKVITYDWSEVRDLV